MPGIRVSLPAAPAKFAGAVSSAAVRVALAAAAGRVAALAGRGRAVAVAGAVVLAVPGAVPSTALAQTPTSSLNPTTSPFSLGVPQYQSTSATTTAAPTVSTVSTSASGGSGLSGSSAVVIGVGALVLIAGISLFIWRDARRRAPVRHRTAEAASGASGRAGSKARQKPRKLSPAERRRRKRGRAR